MFHIREYSLSAILGIWFLLSALRQTRRIKPSWIRKLDPIGLIPSWRFFGPNPTTWDYGLYVRVRDGEGPWGPWMNITPCSRPRFAFLWNPQRRPRKVFFSACRQILTPQKRDIQKLSGYRVVAAYVLTCPLDHSPIRRQFQITRCRALADPENPEPLFLSDEYVYSPSLST